MPVSAVRSTGEFVELVVGAKATRVDFTALAPGAHDEKSSELKNLLQGALDQRERRSTLAREDPDGGSDPGREDLFWNGEDLVSRGVVVESVTWDGETYALELRRATARPRG